MRAYERSPQPSSSFRSGLVMKPVVFEQAQARPQAASSIPTARSERVLRAVQQVVDFRMQIAIPILDRTPER